MRKEHKLRNSHDGFHDINSQLTFHLIENCVLGRSYIHNLRERHSLIEASDEVMNPGRVCDNATPSAHLAKDPDIHVNFGQ